MTVWQQKLRPPHALVRNGDFNYDDVLKIEILVAYAEFGPNGAKIQFGKSASKIDFFDTAIWRYLNLNTGVGIYIWSVKITI